MHSCSICLVLPQLKQLLIWFWFRSFSTYFHIQPWTKKARGVSNLQVFGDSLSVINLLKRIFKMGNLVLLSPYLWDYEEVKSYFYIFNSISFAHVYKELNLRLSLFQRKGLAGSWFRYMPGVKWWFFFCLGIQHFYYWLRGSFHFQASNLFSLFQIILCLWCCYLGSPLPSKALILYLVWSVTCMSSAGLLFEDSWMYIGQTYLFLYLTIFKRAVLFLAYIGGWNSSVLRSFLVKAIELVLGMLIWESSH